jgi:hypothetical protein
METPFFLPNGGPAMKCENIKEATTTCTNEASPGLVFCRECLWQHSEELYKADRERREQEAKIDEAAEGK